MPVECPNQKRGIYFKTELGCDFFLGGQALRRQISGALDFILAALLDHLIFSTETRIMTQRFLAAKV